MQSIASFTQIHTVFPNFFIRDDCHDQHEIGMRLAEVFEEYDVRSEEDEIQLDVDYTIDLEAMGEGEMRFNVFARIPLSRFEYDECSHIGLNDIAAEVSENTLRELRKRGLGKLETEAPRDWAEYDNSYNSAIITQRIVTPITNLVRHGERGWKWEFNDTPYRTNKNGGGLWEYRTTGAKLLPEHEPEMAFQQNAGACQFSLPKNAEDAFLEILREMK